MQLANVLMFCPTHPLSGIMPQTQHAIRNLDGGFSEFYHNAGSLHWHNTVNILRSFQDGREVFLAGKWTHLFVVEYDIIPPADALTRLLDLDADVSYGLYCWRHNKRWSPYTQLDEFGGTSVSLKHETARAAWGQVIDVVGVGFGCTLIRREVLEKLEFRLVSGWEGNFSNDWAFAIDCQRNQFSQRADLNVVCGHIDGAKVLWPTPQNDMLYYTSQLKEIS